MVYYNFDTKTYYKLYYQKNKEHILERVKNNYIKNKKKVKEKIKIIDVKPSDNKIKFVSSIIVKF